MNSIPSSSTTLRRTATALNARRCIIACVCLLIIAAALRFYNLSDNSLWFDEAKAAINSRGALSELVVNTRHENSSPILYPLALWAIQKAASTEFSVRLIPAAASALTVAALLFLMPRLGVPLRAAFIAALLAALSAAAIEHAQDVREYSVDALCAVLMIAGLLQYLRNGGKTLLCATLFAAPLLQYGLILFGGAVIGAAALAPATAPQTLGYGAQRSYAAAVWRRIRQRIDLLLPIACFGAACAISWELTTKYQWVDGGWGGDYYLAKYYYQSGFDIAAIADFAIGRTWDLLIYHMPPSIATAALIVFGALLLLSLKRRRFNALAPLCLLALGIALCAALASAYPLGDVRQCLYLGPIVFLGVGCAFHSLVEAVPALARSASAAALTAAACGAIAFVAYADIQQRNVYHSDGNIKRIFAILEEREQAGDAVYVSAWEFPLVTFYKREKPDNYYYGREVCWESSGRECVSEVFNEMLSAFGSSKRIWMLHTEAVSVPKEMAEYAPEIAVDEIASYGWTTLHLIAGHEKLAASIHQEWLDMNAPAENPVYMSSDSPYNLYIQDNALYYAKQPCAPNDTEDRFFLHIYPEDEADLPADRRQYGFAHLDFDFREYGLLADGKCVARRELPEYPIDRIHTGQSAYSDGSVTWKVKLPFIYERTNVREALSTSALIAASTYDIYTQDNALYYAKQPCAPNDTKDHFFLHIYPENEADLPAHRRRHGFAHLDFGFRNYGLLAEGKCVARRELPEYPIDHIHTGQFIYPDGAVTWDVKLPFNPFNSKEWLNMYDEVVSAAPNIAVDYNLYVQDDAFYYAKQPCAAADIEKRFFLNIYPKDVNDIQLDTHRQYGYEILGFEFHDYGFLASGKCLIRRELPDYPIDRIHTGQFIYPDGGITWEWELLLNR